MVTKKKTSTSAAKTAKKTPPKSVKKTPPKTSPKKTVKTAPRPVSAKPPKIEPYSPVFGLIIIFVSLIVLLAIIVLATNHLSRGGQPSYVISQNTKTDAELMKEEYPDLPDDNVFVLKNSDEIMNILDNGTGIVFLGFPECPWCQTYASMLNNLARANGISEVYYYNIKNDRSENTEFYQEIVKNLDSYLQYDNVGQKFLYVPNITLVKDGEIIANDWETSKDTLGLENPSDYWTEERVEAWKAKLTPAFVELKTALDHCSDSCTL